MLRSETPEASGKPAAVSSAEGLLVAAAREYGDRVAFASSFSVEDQVITSMIVDGGLSIPIFTLDTGRLPQQTYNLIERTEKHFGIRVRVVCPDPKDVEELVNVQGINCFRKEVELRRRCCHVRKVLPLRRALEGMGSWICGLRKEQAMTRADISVKQWDETNELTRYCPLADWSDEEVWAYAKQRGVPYSPLHEEGYQSIGCAPCTRPVRSGEDPRSGRWWWESPEHKECGLHARG